MFVNTEICVYGVTSGGRWLADAVTDVSLNVLCSSNLVNWIAGTNLYQMQIPSDDGVTRYGSWVTTNLSHPEFFRFQATR